MDPGTALAVVSLAIQLAGTVQTINEFLRTIRDAPSELSTLIETMELMQSNLNQVHYLIEQQFSDPSLASSPVFILNALKICEKRIAVQKAWVEEIKHSLTTRHLIKRTWANLSIRPKKTQLSEMQGQLREAMANLHFAVSNNQWHVQLQQVQVTTALHQLQITNKYDACSPVVTDENGLSITPGSNIQYTHQDEKCAVSSAKSSSTLHITSKEQNSIWYRGVFGCVTVREKWISTGTRDSRTDGKPVPAEKVLMMKSLFLRRAVELYFGASFAGVPRALRVYQIIEQNAPIFKMCRIGDLEGIQNQLANGAISPFVVDKYGHTMLHLAARSAQPEICSLLLRLGLDPDRANNAGQKALVLLGLSENDNFNRAIDTMRTLAQAQEEVSSTDVSTPMISLSSLIAEDLLSLDSVREDLVFTKREEDFYPALGAALRGYGAYITSKSFSAQPFPAKWESIIRKLLHIGVDVHAAVPRGDFFHSLQSKSYPCTLSPYGTPLDELFTYTTTAGGAKDAADAWLQILSTEGIDIAAYLEKEKVLHATQAMFTRPWSCDSYLPRQLIFNLGEAPSVHADWWIDPECSTFLVRQEFKDTDMLTWNDDDMGVGWQQYATFWKHVWPIGYPRWSKCFERENGTEERATWERLNARAQERADRRWDERARKTARLNGTQAHPSMPGAWPP